MNKSLLTQKHSTSTLLVDEAKYNILLAHALPGLLGQSECDLQTVAATVNTAHISYATSYSKHSIKQKTGRELNQTNDDH